MVQSPPRFSLLLAKQQNRLYKKYLQEYTINAGTQFPKGLNLVHNEHRMKIQYLHSYGGSSQVLEELGGALTGPMDCKNPILDLRHSVPY